MLRRTLFRSVGAQQAAIFDAALKNKAFKASMDTASGVPSDKAREFEDMQVGMYKQKIEADRQEAAEFLKLPREEQVRRFMLQKGKFDVDLVRHEKMDVAAEFERFKVAHRKSQRKASRSFWIPVTACSIVICGLPIWLITGWY